MRSLRIKPLQLLIFVSKLELHLHMLGDLLADAGIAAPVREGDLISQDICESCVSVLTFERRRAIKHLVDQDTQCPPIDCASVTTAFDDLGCDIFFCSHERVGAEVVDARLGVDGGHIGGVVRDTVTAGHDHGRDTARVGLLGEVKV